ncbi:hypothetical protein AAFF_G00172880 [Aldrovandia affinis]|uniref:Uncharacterized protein n=1 Tax=Aldrovandia affinis TaxID=143900 RepID=A0AAD7WVZ3_9TELE|nr:hypothetical protein AAFF_G00172880 [Aldrovandia affinis]
MSRVILRSGTRSLNAYVLLDDGSERTILLHEAAQQLGLQGKPEDLALRMPLNQVQPLLLIGSNYAHLITPIEPVHLGPPGGPAAIKTQLSWTLQGPSKFLKYSLAPQQCLLTSVISPVLAHLCGTEKCLSKDPEKTAVYNSEVHKLVESSFAKKALPAAVKEYLSGWHIPYHMVHHNGKNRIVFNCSFNYRN